MIRSVAATFVIVLVAVACSTDSPTATPSSVASPVVDATSPPRETTTRLAESDELELSAEAVVSNGDVVIEVEADGFEIRFVEGDDSGETAHVHAFVDRPPPADGDFVPLGDPSIVHSVGATIRVRGLDSGVHRIWVIAADGNDNAMVPPEPVELTVTVP